jgi:glycerol-3-phosphate dehydrogenase
MVCIGTTSFEVEDVNYIPVFKDQVEFMYRSAIALVPAVKNTNQRGAWMSARPLVGKGESGRSLARTFKCFDHQETDGIGGLVTITGGKATTCRVMAEKTVDIVCQKLGISAECVTSQIPLNSYRSITTDKCCLFPSRSNSCRRKCERRKMERNLYHHPPKGR